MNASRTLFSSILINSCFCKPWSPASYTDSTYLNSTMINSTISLCFWVRSSPALYKQSAIWTINVYITLSSMSACLYDSKCCVKSCLHLGSQSSPGSSVSYTINIKVKKDNFLSLSWKQSKGKRSFYKKFHYPRMCLMIGFLELSPFRCFMSCRTDSSQCSLFT